MNWNRIVKVKEQGEGKEDEGERLSECGGGEGTRRKRRKVRRGDCFYEWEEEGNGGGSERGEEEGLGERLVDCGAKGKRRREERRESRERGLFS